MDIKQELSKNKVAIDAEIEKYLDRVIEEKAEVDVFAMNALSFFKKTILAGGKRIRPIMMCYGYRAAGGKDYEKILKTSVSIELIHAFLLMHDDIIDRDDFRHGQKTMHAHYRQYNKKFLFNDEADHFGTSIAIILGDLVYALGNQVLFESKFDDVLIVRALNKLQGVVGLTCVGEMQDVHMEYSKNVSEEDVLKMYENKTARYTFEGPLHLGAMLAGADDGFCQELSKYAIPLGIAFQIRDDILGVFGDEKKTGKPVGSDIAEGKKTLLVIKAFENASKEQKKDLKLLLGNKDINEKDVEKFRQIMVETKALESVEAYMQELVSQAENSLEKISLSDDVKEFFFAVIEYLNKREK
ncbi:MAG: polyprenyl synthetase family protein [Patescibacteria group bacterium]